jgi:hypothetical protein
MTVAELLSRTTSRELSEWMVYYELEPFGEERADLRSGIVASTIANVNRDPKKQKKPYSPQDFLPKFEGGEGVKAALSPEALRRKWEMVVAAFGGGEKKGE